MNLVKLQKTSNQENIKHYKKLPVAKVKLTSQVCPPNLLVKLSQ